MLRKLIIAVLIISCLAMTCEKLADRFAYRFWVRNNSAGTISYLIGKSYPDTLIPGQENLLITLLPGEDSPNDSNKDWEDVFSELPSDTLSIFFFSRDTLLKYGFEETRADYIILKRKDISFNDLKNNDYTVAYP